MDLSSLPISILQHSQILGKELSKRQAKRLEQRVNTPEQEFKKITVVSEDSRLHSNPVLSTTDTTMVSADNYPTVYRTCYALKCNNIAIFTCSQLNRKRQCSKKMCE